MEKGYHLISSDGEAGGDTKPEIVASEGVTRGDKGQRFVDLDGLEAVIKQ
jgi:hypothetical protein